MAITLAKIENLVLQKARLLGPNNNIINNALTLPQLDNLILEAMQRVTEETLMPRIWGKTTWPITTPSTQEVSLPADCFKLLRVYLNGKEIMPNNLIDLNMEVQLVYDATWQMYVADSVNTPLALGDPVAFSKSSGNIFQYYMREQQPKKLGMVPAVNAGHSLVIDYVQLPALPVGNTPLNYPDDFQKAIVEETLWRLHRMLRRHQDAEAIKGDAKEELARASRSIHDAQSQYIEIIKPYPYNQHFGY